MENQRTDRELKKMSLELSQATRTQSILNKKQIQKLWAKTPDSYKYKRPAKGGGQWTYVKGSYVRKALDSVFGFNWDFVRITTDSEIQEWVKMGTRQVIVYGQIIGRVKLDSGEWVEIKKSATGRADIKFRKDTEIPLDIGNDIKSAETDCLKKCASKLGIASDVYEQDEFIEIEIVEDEPETPSEKATSKILEELKAKEEE